ncbi:MAG: hypothetical protein J4215_04625 [Candidatus Diapherotrites archaeon]|uniref:Uncharacterized protein n=1 Tax=Candidatus Iainarchaeum sp. TaxID=3101447 RepID=A0A8T4L5F7_9ARCH|nr:hypothetical protein [Candidatus Diapherotrites archaeon]
MVLNFPVGDAVVHLAPLSQFDAERVFELQKQKFSGYLVATIEGASGVEEGLLFLLEGKVVACAYSLDAFDIISYAQTGLQLFFNALAAPNGIVDVYGLSRQQVELILALEEKIGVEDPGSGLRSLVAKRYSAELVQKLIPKESRPAAADSRKFEVLKKIELGELFK